MIRLIALDFELYASSTIQEGLKPRIEPEALALVAEPAVRARR